MRKTAAAILVLVASAGCQNSVAVQREAEIVASTGYDDIDCRDLEARRDALAARHGLAPTVTRAPLPESATPGFGILIPDQRSEAERERARAVGEISAMNRSMERRSCGRT